MIVPSDKVREKCERNFLFPARRLAFAIALGAGVLGSAHAGEKIQFSTSTNSVQLPKDPSKEFIVPPSDLLHSKIGAGASSEGPALPQPGQQTLMRNPMLDDWLDRKKNWIFDSPNNLDRDKAVKEIFGVRESEFRGLENKSKSSVDRYFDAKDTKPTSSLPNSINGRPDALSARDGQNPFEVPGTPGAMKRNSSAAIIPELNPAHLFKWNTVPEAFSTIGDDLTSRSILPVGLGDPSFVQKPITKQGRESTPGQQDIDRIWASRQLPLNRLSDPINGFSDSTRNPINPISAQRPGSVTSEGSASRLGDGPMFANTAPVSVPRTESFDLANEKALGPSISPSASAVSSAPIIQPKPAVLEIPRPRF